METSHSVAVINVLRLLQLNLCHFLLLNVRIGGTAGEPSRFPKGQSHPHPAAEQLPFWSTLHENHVTIATKGNGCPTPSLTSTLSIGPRGPLLLQDSNFLDHLAHFDRERIPERVVHAKGGGAFGYFQVTHDIRHLTRAALFQGIGKKTPVLVRFSTSVGESGSADTVRDVRGFSVKFYTEEGNWDLAGFNIENFAIRDPILFPSLIHTRKRNPVTHLRDPNMFWDFTSLKPEGTLNTLFLFSDRGIPDGFRHMHGFGVHAFKLINADGAYVFVKFQWFTNQGLAHLTQDEADRIAGVDPDYAIRDLYNAIAAENFPTWTLVIQVMTEEEAEKLPYNPFDLTKVWLLKDFPLRHVGKLVLDRNPRDYFTEVEQAVFHPGNLVPGIEPSPSDKILQGRIFSYSDAQRYRLGTNFQQLPINRPHVKVATYERDGQSCYSDNGRGAPNYFPNSFSGPVEDVYRGEAAAYKTEGVVGRWEQYDNDLYTQATLYWEKALSLEERQRLVDNIARELSGATAKIQKRVLENNIAPVSQQMASMLQTALDNWMQAKKK